jgi:hypothetical protein
MSDYLKTTKSSIKRIGQMACAVLFLMSCSDDDEKEAWEKEVDQLRNAVAGHTAINDAIAKGYDNEFTGYRAHMGFHYLKASLLDGTFEIEKPEVLMFAPDENGELKFVGAEYAVPIEDLSSPPPAPEGFTGSKDVWAINEEFSVWTLHVWVGLENPDGVFAAHNHELP